MSLVGGGTASCANDWKWAMAACMCRPAAPRVDTSRAGGAGGGAAKSKDMPPPSSSSLGASSPWLVGGLLSDSAAAGEVTAGERPAPVPCVGGGECVGCVQGDVGRWREVLVVRQRVVRAGHGRPRSACRPASVVAGPRGRAVGAEDARRERRGVSPGALVARRRAARHGTALHCTIEGPASGSDQTMPCTHAKGGSLTLAWPAVRGPRRCYATLWSGASVQIDPGRTLPATAPASTMPQDLYCCPRNPSRTQIATHARRRSVPAAVCKSWLQHVAHCQG
ncbi:hypothetical protein OPT61_g9765 [Boeremia exigua]|uniref:Uncharacterized protein n=1 Tax=Boeremia exigua TaxID=749465 RepID=A0ACC2HSN5_9PLEO|nr:hypothetical protein OPT61_g9765 [Boeremia exigua]